VAHDQNEGDDVFVFVFPPLFLAHSNGFRWKRGEGKANDKVRQPNLGQESQNCIRVRSLIQNPEKGVWNYGLHVAWYYDLAFLLFSCLQLLTHSLHTPSLSSPIGVSFGPPAAQSDKQKASP